MVSLDVMEKMVPLELGFQEKKDIRDMLANQVKLVLRVLMVRQDQKVHRALLESATLGREEIKALKALKVLQV